MLGISLANAQSYQRNELFLRLKMDESYHVITDSFVGVYSPNKQSIQHPRANEFKHAILPLKIDTSTDLIGILYNSDSCQSDTNYLVFNTTKLSDSIVLITNLLAIEFDNSNNKTGNDDLIYFPYCSNLKTVEDIQSLVIESIDYKLISKIYDWSKEF